MADYTDKEQELIRKTEKEMDFIMVACMDCNGYGNNTIGSMARQPRPGSVCPTCGGTGKMKATGDLKKVLTEPLDISMSAEVKVGDKWPATRQHDKS